MSNGVKVSNPPKALIVLVALLCITTLMIVNRVDPEAGLGVIGLIVGYAIGNGIAARDGDPIKPIFDQKNPHRRQEDRPTEEDE